LPVACNAGRSGGIAARHVSKTLFLAGDYYDQVPAGTYDISLRARSRGNTIATAPAVSATVDEIMPTDLGTLELVPCGDACP
jgi:hypothetical protein